MCVYPENHWRCSHARSSNTISGKLILAARNSQFAVFCLWEINLGSSQLAARSFEKRRIGSSCTCSVCPSLGSCAMDARPAKTRARVARSCFVLQGPHIWSSLCSTAFIWNGNGDWTVPTVTGQLNSTQFGCEKKQYAVKQFSSKVCSPQFAARFP